MKGKYKFFILFSFFCFLNLTSGVSQTLEINKENSKSSIDRIKDIKRIILSLEV